MNIRLLEKRKKSRRAGNNRVAHTIIGEEKPISTCGHACDERHCAVLCGKLALKASERKEARGWIFYA